MTIVNTLNIYGQLHFYETGNNFKQDSLITLDLYKDNHALVS